MKTRAFLRTRQIGLNYMIGTGHWLGNLDKRNPFAWPADTLGRESDFRFCPIHPVELVREHGNTDYRHDQVYERNRQRNRH